MLGVLDVYMVCIWCKQVYVRLYRCIKGVYTGCNTRMMLTLEHMILHTYVLEPRLAFFAGVFLDGGQE